MHLNPFRREAAASMVLRSVLAFSICCATHLSMAQQGAARPPLGPPTDLRSAQSQHEAAMASVEARFAEKRREALAAYAQALQQVQQAATQRGDLDTALAAKEQVEYWADPNAGPPAKAPPKAILPHYQRFDENVAQARQAASRDMAAQIKRHLAILEQLQINITKKGDLDGATEIKKTREGLAADLTRLEAGNATITLPPSGTTPPPPTAVTATRPGGPSVLSLNVSAVSVVTELQTKGNPVGAATGTIVFSGPPGNGRGGARGIVLTQPQAAAQAVRNGSTWAFKYQRGGSARGLQIIHPTGEGQMIVSVNPAGVGLSTPKAWTEVGYGAGDVKRPRMTAAAKKIFPLQDGIDYVVVSRLSASGSYELFINGELVATGRASTAPPLDLTIPADTTYPDAGRGKLEFKSADANVFLPLKWSVGWAGLILGPMDNGKNVCMDVRFYPGVVEMAAAKR